MHSNSFSCWINVEQFGRYSIYLTKQKCYKVYNCIWFNNQLCFIEYSRTLYISIEFRHFSHSIKWKEKSPPITTLVAIFVVNFILQQSGWKNMKIVIFTNNSIIKWKLNHYYVNANFAVMKVIENHLLTSKF